VQAIAFFNDGKYTSFMSGLSLVGCARCIAMVIVWVELAKGDREYCAAIVALNSVITIFLYSPYALLFLVTMPQAMLGTTGTNTLDVTMGQIAISVGIYLGVPLAAGVLCWYVVSFPPRSSLSLRVRVPKSSSFIPCSFPFLFILALLLLLRLLLLLLRVH
jgi:ACR3 family arsenite efflux pump ArsB